LTEGQLMSVASEALMMTMKLALPFLLGSLVVGLVVSLFQTVTQLQEVTLTFVPKLVVVAVILIVAGHWMLGQMEGYTTAMISQTASLVGG